MPFSSACCRSSAFVATAKATTFRFERWRRSAFSIRVGSGAMSKSTTMPSYFAFCSSSIIPSFPAAVRTSMPSSLHTAVKAVTKNGASRGALELHKVHTSSSTQRPCKETAMGRALPCRAGANNSCASSTRNLTHKGDFTSSGITTDAI